MAVHTVQKMTPEQHALTDATIRRFRYVDLDGMLTALKAANVKISRSSLGRYSQKLRQQDGALMGTPDDTIIVIMERSTGATTTISTSASRAAIIALIQGV